ncbi:MAG: hypothetical protein ACI91R_001576 [Vicingaceae bacterium]
MNRKHSILILLVCALAACSPGGSIYNTSKSVRKVAPSGKFKNPTIFSRANPFQGRAKAKLNKNKKRKRKLFRRKQTQNGTFRKSKKPGRTFGKKRSLPRRRMKSSGSRSKSNAGGGRGNKNLFNTRKK